MWAHAEDLDTLEFALMQVIAYIAGSVRILTVFVVCFYFSDQHIFTGCVH